MVCNLFEQRPRVGHFSRRKQIMKFKIFTNPKPFFGTSIIQQLEYDKERNLQGEVPSIMHALVNIISQEQSM
jgi:hypothetical protein